MSKYLYWSTKILTNRYRIYRGTLYVILYSNLFGSRDDLNSTTRLTKDGQNGTYCFSMQRCTKKVMLRRMSNLNTNKDHMLVSGQRLYISTG